MKKSLSKLIQAFFDVLVGFAIYCVMAVWLKMAIYPIMLIPLAGAAVFAEWFEISQKE